MSLYMSMASTINQLVDCRMIQLEMDAFLLSSKQLMSIANYCALYTHNLLSNGFYSEWDWNNKKTSSDLVLERTSKPWSNLRCFDFGCYADVLSPVVYNAKSFRDYDKMLFSPNSIAIRLEETVSHDYVDSLQVHLADLNNRDLCRDAVLSLFYEKGKKMCGFWRNHDVTTLFLGQKDEGCLDMYSCSFNFRIAIKCLNDIGKFTDELVNFVIETTHISQNINARIALSPIQSPARCSAHMLYFGGKTPEGYTESCTKLFGPELYPYCHFYGAEWFNLLSPLISLRLTGPLLGGKCYDDLIVDRLSNGITIVKSVKSVDSIDVCDLLNIRKYLYSVLYPGSSKILLENLNNPEAFGYLAKPRQQWEYIPILPEEISCDQNAIYFSYQDRGRFA